MTKFDPPEVHPATNNTQRILHNIGRNVLLCNVMAAHCSMPMQSFQMCILLFHMCYTYRYVRSLQYDTKRIQLKK